MKQNRYQNKNILLFMFESSLTEKVGFYVFLRMTYRIRFRNCNFEVLETKHWNWSIWKSEFAYYFTPDPYSRTYWITTASVCNNVQRWHHKMFMASQKLGGVLYTWIVLPRWECTNVVWNKRNLDSIHIIKLLKNKAMIVCGICTLIFCCEYVCCRLVVYRNINTC
jgi:hypothetical protein